MSNEKNEKKVHGIVAEYTTVDSLLSACNRVREAGYLKTDAYTPFAVHGIDKALGIKPTVLPWIALAAGLTGTSIALAMQIGLNAYDYPYIISGKPFISLPAFIPVTFELTILLASFGTFFGMWGLNGLPKFSNPVFTNPRFDRATDDTFFLYVDSKDRMYDADGVKKLFADTGGEHVTEVVDDDSSDKVPGFVMVTWAIVVAISIIPLLVAAKMRVTNSSSPRFHIFPDMDFSPSRDAQQTSTLFADSRSSRPDVPGTIARGQTGDDLDFETGINMDKLAAIDSDRTDHLVRTYLADDKTVDGNAGGTASGGTEKTVMDTTPWLDKNPLTLDAETLALGQEQFQIYCAVCHGNDGAGNGLVNQRAKKILAPAWIPPSSLHQDILYADKYADGKLFSTISNGIRKMPGYSGQIKTRSRWAIVAYVRALQQSQNASIDLVPVDRRDGITKQKADVDKKLAAAAEKKRKEAERAKEATK